MTADEQILGMVDKVEACMPGSPTMQLMMRPVLLDIAVQIYRQEPLDATFARRMGMDLHNLDAIVRIMKGETV